MLQASANVLLWGYHVDLGRASFGGWELGPPSASEMAPDLETSPATLQTPQYPALQYLHKTAQYAEWGSYNICACPPYLCTYNHMFGAGGIWRASRQEQQRIWVAALSFGRIWVDTMHLAPTTHFSKYYFFKNCCNQRKWKSFFVHRQDSHAAWDRFPQNLSPSDTLVKKQSKCPVILQRFSFKFHKLHKRSQTLSWPMRQNTFPFLESELSDLFPTVGLVWLPAFPPLSKHITLWSAIAVGGQKGPFSHRCPWSRCCSPTKRSVVGSNNTWLIWF